MRRLFGRSLLFSAIASMVLADGLPVTHTAAVDIPDMPQPGYLESCFDPTFGADECGDGCEDEATHTKPRRP